MKNYTNYLKKLLSITILLVALVSGFNVSIDPYRLFDSPLIDGLNAQKPEAINQAALAKRYNILRQNPGSIIMGNSRPQMGLSTSHPCWPKGALPVFNAAITGAAITTQIKAIQNAYQSQNVKYVLMALDYIDFLQLDTSKSAESIFNELEKNYNFQRKTEVATDISLQKVSDFLKSATSLDTFKASLLTVTNQEENDTSSITSSGFHNADLLYHPLIENEGHQAILDQKRLAIIKDFERLNIRKKSNPQQAFISYKLLSRLAKHSKSINVEIVFFINPYHAEYLSLLKQAGMWQAFNQWKENLSALAKIEGVDLWDFSEFSIYLTDPIGHESETKPELNWFWEPSHYTKELGDILLQRIHRVNCQPNISTQEDWGELISVLPKASLNEYLSRQTKALERYEASRTS